MTYNKIGRIKTESVPDDPRAHFDLGVQLIELEKYDEALIVLERGYQLRPDWVPLLFNIGFAHDKLNHTEEAIRFYEQALSYDPHHQAALCNLGLLHQRCGRWDAAIIAFHKCLEKQSEYLPGLINLSSLLREKKHFSESIDYLLQAQNLCPNFSPIYKSLALNYRDIKDWDEAERCLNRWIELEGDHEIEGRLLLSETCIFKEDWEEAVSQCDRTLKLLKLPRDIVINNFYDLATIFLTIAESLKRNGKPHLARIAESQITLINNIAQVTYQNK